MKSTRGKIKVFFVLYFGDHLSSQSLQSCIMKFRCIFREDCMKLFWETTYKVNHGRHYPRIVAHRSILARTWFQVQINVFPSIREPEHHVVSVILLPILLTTWIIPSHWCCLAVYKTVSIAKYSFFSKIAFFAQKRVLQCSLIHSWLAIGRPLKDAPILFPRLYKFAPSTSLGNLLGDYSAPPPKEAKLYWKVEFLPPL